MSKKARSLAEFLRSQRLASGFTQMDLARKLGYATSQFISNWEMGRSSPPLDAIAQLIEILDINQSEVIDILMHEEREHITQRLRVARDKTASK